MIDAQNPGALVVHAISGLPDHVVALIVVTTDGQVAAERLAAPPTRKDIRDRVGSDPERITQQPLAYAAASLGKRPENHVARSYLAPQAQTARGTVVILQGLRETAQGFEIAPGYRGL